MSDSLDDAPAKAATEVDLEMTGTADVEIASTMATVNTVADEVDGADSADATDMAATAAPSSKKPEDETFHTNFASYLSSPIVALVLRAEDGSVATLSAHQSLLTRSVYFREACAGLEDSARRIDLTDEDIGAVGSFLEFLYTGDYYPRKLVGHSHKLERQLTEPEVDETGEQLLKHARIYTLANKFKLPQLQALASSKIHCVNSTAKGEIAYARYVYAYTAPDDTVVRNPVAKFWAMRSHSLRSEAESEFQSLCLEFPQFSYDVLTRILDEKLKRDTKPAAPTGSARKRFRTSTSVE